MLERVLLVEDHPIVLLGLRQLITGRWPNALVDSTDKLADGIRLASSGSYDIAIVDLNLPDASGLESVNLMQRQVPSLRLLVLSLNDEAAYAQRVLQMGASGYLSKDRAATELVLAIEHICSGRRYIPSSQAERIAEIALGQAKVAPHETLSTQEYRVLVYLAEGRRLTEIGQLMHLSSKTVTTYRARVLDKLHLHTNRELIQYCLDHGISHGNA